MKLQEPQKRHHSIIHKQMQKYLEREIHISEKSPKIIDDIRYNVI